MVRKNSNDTLSLKQIDGIGDALFIPLATYSKFFGRKQILRRIEKFIKNVYLDFPQYSGELDFILENLKSKK